MNGRWGAFLTALPLLALPVLLYNLTAMLVLEGGLGALDAQARLAEPVASIPMGSGALWILSTGDVLVITALFVLFIELLKSTSSRGTAIVNHGLSMLLFVVCLLQFLLLEAFATSAFFLITLMVLLDVLAGFIVSIVAARRDFAVDE
jgi:hypothetical protein